MSARAASGYPVFFAICPVALKFCYSYKVRVPIASDIILTTIFAVKTENRYSGTNANVCREAGYSANWIICQLLIKRIVCQLDLNHHPSLSDYLAALLTDVDKQIDAARAERLQHSRGRRKRSVIKEQQVINVLDAANFDTDEGLIDAVYLLGLVMQGFVDELLTKFR
ncbi:hypothetical protein DdX_16465 [Ditylenchus destructor]|uniref:Uncharacterized protein n=1 Tax=Ditylenchus destructor TaxID=166010 RepID=A0AAD4QZX5_9BILA|nr:hypothetical protein DdX_16465 [Ditylenchus destructor]